MHIFCQIFISILHEKFIVRPVIKENTTRVVVAYQVNVILLWCVINVKLNIVKKTAGLEIVTLNCEKI